MRFLIRLLIVLFVLFAVGYVIAAANTSSPLDDHAALTAQFAEMRAVIEAADVSVESISGWSTHQHVEHVLLADRGILDSIAAGESPPDAVGRNVLGTIVLATGRIPRGRGDAPESTVPEARDTPALLVLLGEVETRALGMEPAKLAQSDVVVANHPAFGGLTSAEWLRLMSVHGAHHQAIVDEIEAATPAP